MSGEPDFLSVEDLLQVHDEQLAAYGAAAGIRDRPLPESAVATPQASLRETYLREDPHPPRSPPSWHRMGGRGKLKVREVEKWE